MKTCEVDIYTVEGEPAFTFVFYGITARDLMMVPCVPLQRAMARRGLDMNDYTSSPFFVRENETHQRILRSRGPAYVRVQDRAKHELAALGL